MKVLLTGGDGFVGKNFLKVCSAIAPTRSELDLASPYSIEKIADYSPDVILHLACDQGPTNEVMAEHVKVAADLCRARIVFLTTDVSGNEYAESKRRAERIILGSRNWLIVRCSLLCDPETGERPLEWARILKGECVRLNTREFRNAMNVSVLCELLTRLLRDDVEGDLNVGGEPISRYELGKQFAEARGLGVFVFPVNAGADFTMDLKAAKALYPDLIGQPAMASVDDNRTALVSCS